MSFPLVIGVLWSNPSRFVDTEVFLVNFVRLDSFGWNSLEVFVSFHMSLVYLRLSFFFFSPVKFLPSVFNTVRMSGNRCGEVPKRRQDFYNWPQESYLGTGDQDLPRLVPNNFLLTKKQDWTNPRWTPDCITRTKTKYRT